MITQEFLIESPLEGMLVMSAYARVVTFMARQPGLYDFNDDEDVRDAIVAVANGPVSDGEVEDLLQLTREILPLLELPDA